VRARKKPSPSLKMKEKKVKNPLDESKQTDYIKRVRRKRRGSSPLVEWGVGLTDKSTDFYSVHHAGSIPARPATLKSSNQKCFFYN
jgi:hypothetical protein